MWPLGHKGLLTFSTGDLSIEHLINKVIYWLMQICSIEGWDLMIIPDTLHDINVSS